MLENRDSIARDECQFGLEWLLNSVSVIKFGGVIICGPATSPLLALAAPARGHHHISIGFGNASCNEEGDLAC